MWVTEREKIEAKQYDVYSYLRLADPNELVRLSRNEYCLRSHDSFKISQRDGVWLWYWYSRDFGNTFYHVFEHSKYAPNYPNAHIHGICVDPYFDRLYVITGDSGRNSRIYWWDYNRETLNNELWNTIEWKYIETAMDIHSGSSFQFVCGYALKDCVILGSDGQ